MVTDEKIYCGICKIRIYPPGVIARFFGARIDEYDKIGPVCEYCSNIRSKAINDAQYNIQFQKWLKKNQMIK